MDTATTTFLHAANDFSQEKLGEDVDDVTIRTKGGHVLTLRGDELPRQSADDRRSAAGYVWSLLPEFSDKDGISPEALMDKGGYTSKSHVLRILRQLKREKKAIEDDRGFKKAK